MYVSYVKIKENEELIIIKSMWYFCDDYNYRELKSKYKNRKL